MGTIRNAELQPQPRPSEAKPAMSKNSRVEESAGPALLFPGLDPVQEFLPREEAISRSPMLLCLNIQGVLGAGSSSQCG